jgi:hypothetical protein
VWQVVQNKRYGNFGSLLRRNEEQNFDHPNVQDYIQDYATLGNRDNFDSTSITIDFWLKRPTPTGTYRRLFQTGDDTGAKLGYILTTGPSSNFNQFYFVVQENFTTSERIFITPHAPASNEVINITATFSPYDTAGGGSRIYINGTKMHVTGDVTSWSTSSNTQATIGARTGGTTQYASMTMYNFMVYNRALRPVEIQNNFMSNRVRFGI